MFQPSFARFLFPLMQNGKAEIFLGLILVACSLTIPEATTINIISQLLILAIIPLLRNRYPLALLPLGTFAGLWINGTTDHLLLSGFIFYLTLEYAVAVKKRIIAALLVVEWFALAYGITIDTLLAKDLIPSIMLECVLVVLAAAVGHARFSVMDSRQQQEAAQKQLDQELKSSLARYLHDSIARSLTMMTMQAEIAGMSTSNLKLSQQLKDIKDTGKTAVADLHQLVSHLVEANPERSATMLGSWHADSISETINTAVPLLNKSGYEVTATNIDFDLRLSRTAEAAFSLAFNEATANLVKHSPRHSPVSIAVENQATHVNVAILNKRYLEFSHEMEESSSHRMGLASMKTRMAEIGGSVHVAATPATWQVTLSIPKNNNL